MFMWGLGLEGRRRSNAKVCVVAVFKVARNPEADSTLPFVIAVLLASGRPRVEGQRRLAENVEGVLPRAGRPNPRSSKRFPCGPAGGVASPLTWSWTGHGRSLPARAHEGCETGREGIFRQSARTTRKTRPGLRVPARRAAAGVVEIVVDTRERYAWWFSTQQAATVRRALIVGDYAVELEAPVVGAVERKTLADLAARLVDGSLLVLLGELCTVQRAAVVVDRWADVFRLQHVSPGMVAELLPGAQVRYPNVPIVFRETRKLAEEWA